jgi:hypothetical protein
MHRPFNQSIAETSTRQAAFRPLEQAAFTALEHGAFHKGLLKPFKGKGELSQFAGHCDQLISALIHLATHDVLVQAERYPFTLLQIRLTRQTTGAGTVFLRWVRVDRSQMGVSLWDELVLDQRTPVNLVHDLYALEIQRIALNMQISLMHSMSRQAVACADKMRRAETTYQRRMHSTNITRHEEA